MDAGCVLADEELLGDLAVRPALDEASSEKVPSDPLSTNRGKAARDGRGEALGGMDYYGHTKAELYDRARDLGVEGRSTMNKLELARAIDRKQD